MAEAIQRSCSTVMTLEHLEVRLAHKTVHVSRHKTDDCGYEFSFEAVVHHEGSDGERLTEDEKDSICGSLTHWEPLKITVG